VKKVISENQKILSENFIIKNGESEYISTKIWEKRMFLTLPRINNSQNIISVIDLQLLKIFNLVYTL